MPDLRVEEKGGFDTRHWRFARGFALDSEPGVAAQLRLALRSLVEAKLREHWSPERTSGRFAREKVASAGAARICRHVWADRAGDWEVDTMIGGGHRGALVSMVDRATKFTPLLSMPK